MGYTTSNNLYPEFGIGCYRRNFRKTILSISRCAIPCLHKYYVFMLIIITLKSLFTSMQLRLTIHVASINIIVPRSHAIEMVFVFIVTGHAGSSARSFMLSQNFLRLWVSDPVQSPVTKCPHLYLNCRRAWKIHVMTSGCYVKGQPYN